MSDEIIVGMLDKLAEEEKKRNHTYNPDDEEFSDGRQRVTGLKIDENSMRNGRRRVNSRPNRESQAIYRDDMEEVPVLDTMDDEGRFTGYHIPKVCVKRFEEQGYRTAFFTYENFSYQSEVFEKAREGWIPVLISEIPELAHTLVPYSSFFNDEHKQYFIYLDHLLMKITHENWDRYMRVFNRMISQDEKRLVDAVHRSSRHGTSRLKYDENSYADDDARNFMR